MRKGLTGPPVNAPVLPENHFYRIVHRIGDMGPNYWEVRIMKKGRVFTYTVGRGIYNTKNREGVVPAERAIRGACERAYHNMEETRNHQKDLTQYQGDWSG